MRFSMIVLFLGFLGGCQQYEINYIGQVQIVEQEIKSPEARPMNYNGSVVRNNTAIHFTLENMEIEDLDNIDFLWLKAFVCGQSKYETDLLSALYFPGEIKFADGPPDSQTDKSFYGVFIPRLLVDMKESAKTQNKPICARVVSHEAWELKKTSNLVELGKLE